MRSVNPHHVVLSLLCLVLVIGCETVVDYDDSDFKSQLVINSYFSPDSIWEVHVSRTKSIFDGSTDLGIEDADILIQDITSNFEFKLDHIRSGVYQTSHKPQSNHIYHIIVEDDDLGISRAIGKVPSVENIQITSSLVESNDSKYLNIEVHSAEFDNSDTYFAWQLVNVEETNFVEGGNLNEHPSEVASEVTIRDFTTTDLVFVDGRSLNGNTVTDSIPNDVINDIINQTDISDVKNNAAIKLVAISKELYEYYHNQEEHVGHQSSNSNQTSEYYTNVINGVGIFGGYREIYIEL